MNVKQTVRRADSFANKRRLKIAFAKSVFPVRYCIHGILLFLKYTNIKHISKCLQLKTCIGTLPFGTRPDEKAQHASKVSEC